MIKKNPKTLKKGVRTGLGKKKVRDTDKQLKTQAAAGRRGDTGAGATLANRQCRDLSESDIRLRLGGIRDLILWFLQENNFWT